MIRRQLLSLALIAAAIAFAPVPVSADWVRACAPERSGAARGPGQVTVPSSTIASSYTLDRLGCAIVGGVDRGYLASQGYTFDPGFGSLQLRNIIATPATILLPKGAIIHAIIAQETSGAGVVGGYLIGTQAGGGQILSVGSLPASSIRANIASPIQLPAVSTTAAQLLHYSPVANQNPINSNVNLTIIYSFF